MDHTQKSDQLKRLPMLLGSSSLRHRKEGFEYLTSTLESSEDLPDNFVKGIVQLLISLIPSYIDRRSQHQLLTVITTVGTKYASSSRDFLITSYATQAQEHSNCLNSNKNLSRYYAYAFKVGCHIWATLSKAGANLSQKHCSVLVDAISIYFALSIHPSCKKLVRRVLIDLAAVWKNPSDMNMFCGSFKSEDMSFQKVILGGWLLKHLVETKSEYDTSEVKSGLIQSYVKIVLLTKIKPPLFILEQSSVLLKQVDHKEFSEVILPVVQKSLLRNPEVILVAAGHLFMAVNIDLSRYVEQICKVIQSPLHAKEDQIREETVFICHQLAKQCTDSKAVQTLIKFLFDVYNGSDGKLTVNTHKISVLQALEKTSDHRVSGNAATILFEDVALRLTKILENESHEASLVQAITCLTSWSGQKSRTPTADTIKFIEKAINFKSSTSAVRLGYFQFLMACVNQTTASKFTSLIPVIMQAIDKAIGLPSQCPMVTEAVCGCTLILKIVSFDMSVQEKVEPLWASALDLSKNIFTAEKFMRNVQPEGLHQLLGLCQILLQNHPNKLGANAPLIHTSLLWCLSCSYPDVRQSARKAALYLCTRDRDLILALVSALGEMIDKYPIQTIEQVEELNESPRDLSGIGIIQGLLTICSVKSLPRVLREKVAIHALKIAHQVPMTSENGNLWAVFCKTLDLSPSAVIEKQKDSINEIVMAEFKATSGKNSLVSCICRYAGKFIYSFMIPNIEKSLDDPGYLDVTDQQIEIYRTPVGVLYNQKVVDEAFDIDLTTKNLKKSTKVYTHKEQLMMVEEKRKEIEKKRKLGQLELTPKQKEIMAKEMEKEQDIRTRLTALETKAAGPLELLSAAADGNLNDLCQHYKTVVPLLVKYMSSKLLGERISWIFYKLRKGVFDGEDQLFGSAVGRITLLSHDACIAVPVDWRGEVLASACTRVIQQMYKRTEPGSDDESNHLTAAGFVYCYPLIEFVLLGDPITDAQQRDKVAWHGLCIIKRHLAMRGKHIDGLYHPRFLPREMLLKLIINIISTRDGRIQQMACAVLTDVCVCASGLPGCDRASQQEIYVLLNTLTAPALSVRDASLRGLTVLIESLSNLSLNADSLNMMMHRLFVAKHDEDEDIQKISSNLWTKAGMKCTPTLLNLTLNDVSHPTVAIRISAAKALATLASEEDVSVDNIIKKLIEIYKKKMTMTPEKRDHYDHVVEEAIDHWEGRSGVALSLLHLAPLLEEKSVVNLAKFFVPDSLGDRSERVRTDMLEAAMAVVNSHGKGTVNNLLPIFEKFLNNAPNKASFDAVRQSVVILMGSLAKHLDQSSPKIKPIVAKLIDALSTPSQQVQESVANCLHPLIPAIKEDTPKIVSKLINILLESSNYGQRKGAAYGLASVVKGLGILSLKQLDIMNQLTVAIQDKKVFRYREGALFALEQLCNMLGKLFEPYIVHVLPHLLLCFGDGNNYVRQAADDTAKAVMSKLSAHGVKLVLPSLLAALEEDSWRTKTGSVDLLGNMAFCAPKQLSSCLPSIVPRLIEVLSDSHQKVQTAGAQALKLIGSVIRNPEIQAIVPVLLDALQDPSKNTSTCLLTLLETKFVHFIDAPSLALIMPVVQRAFQDRSTEVRKMAAQIIGNMYSLTDQKDLAPYLPNIIPGLKNSLLDPVPKVRSVSARALGAMVRGMGESSFDDLLPWLMVTLTSEASPVDRSGAAQGLAEVVGGLGPEKLHRLMPDIVATAERADIAPHVKDGYIMMFIFLPTVFEDEFTPYIGQIIPPILKALADENEFVRDTALRAGQRIVNTYAASAVTLLLPELENGLFHDNWRIRVSSVQLLGDLLYRVSGVSGKMTTDTANEDDNFGTEHSQKALIEVLGADRRNRVLAGLYMGRSDVALMVRQAALHVWKVVVTNTPKTLREILPTLFSLLLSCLASTSYDKRQVAARTLGDLVRKLGERVLPEIIPILENGLKSEDPDHRQGVCIGLSEIMASTSRDMVLSFADNLVPTVRKALCDPLPAVREAAAHTFDSLHGTIGIRALDDILPHLLAQLNDQALKSDMANGDEKTKEELEGEYALDGLKQVMAIKGRVVLPYLIPQLTMTPVNTQALCILSAVAGETLTKHLHKILPALLAALSETADTPDYSTALVHCQEVVLAVVDDVGINSIVEELLSYSKNTNIPMARAAVALLLSFCSSTKADYTEYAPQLVRGLIHLFTSKDDMILQSAWNALGSVTKNLDAPTQRALVSDVRQSVKFAASDLKGDALIPGFCLPKGIQPILPIFREAILNGEPDQKEAASNGLTEVIRLTSSDALKTSVVHITGPLIRILGDRFAWNVKVAVLDTLALLLQKAGALLKPFLPQLQTTFVKAVHDPHRGVRLKAGHALSHLITIHNKPDPLFTELHNSLRMTDDVLLRETLLQSVRSVVAPCGNRMSDSVSEALLTTLTSLLYSETEGIRLGAAGALGAHLKWVQDGKARQVINQYILDDNPNLDWSVRHGKSTALFSALKSCPDRLIGLTSEDKVHSALLSYLSSDRVSLVEHGVYGVGFLLHYRLLKGEPIPHNMVVAFGKGVNHSSNEVKLSVCRSCQYVSEALYTTSDTVLFPGEVAKSLLPMLVNASKEKNMVVRSSAEMALIAMLKVKDGAPPVKELINLFEGGAKDSLMEVVNKNLRKASYVPVTQPEMDPTLLT